MQDLFEIQALDDKYVLSINDIYYTINELTYYILSQIKEEKLYNEIAANVEEKFQVSATEEEIESILRDQITPLFEKQHITQNHKVNSFWFKKELISFDRYEFLVKPLQFLFNPFFFWITLFPLLFLNLYWLFNLVRPTSNIEGCETSIMLSTVVYVSLFFIIIFHELAHASSAFKFGVKAKTIGFGFYSIFPVFYADITGIWALNKNKRMIVNLAGIFVQSILGIILYLVYTNIAIKDTSIFLIHSIYFILIANSMTILINLFPFFKFDGYWCYSDFFNIPNLSKRSKIVALSILKKITSLPIPIDQTEVKEVNFKNIPLLVFTFFKSLTNLFLVVIIYKLITRFIKNISSISLNTNESFSLCTLKTLLFYGLFMLIFGKLLYNYIKYLYILIIKK